MLDGRVKTLHPKVHGGLLYIRGNAEHEAQAAKHGIKPIDLVVVNLYPFEKTVAKPGVSLARSHREHRHRRAEHVAQRGEEPRERHGGGRSRPITRTCCSDIQEHGGDTCATFRWKLAVKVFETTARYDGAIAQYLDAERAKAKGETAEA